MSNLRSRNLYEPGKTFKLSRSKIDNFIRCPRCFYLDRRLGLKQPSGPPFTINSAVDALLKKEFDYYRQKEEPHPTLMKAEGVEAIPFKHKDLNNWRNNFKGVQFLHEPTNLLLFGAIDDVWVKPNQELIVVDYKATSKKDEVNLNADWQISYKRQMEFYQWLLRQNGFKVSDTGYFVYCNGVTDTDFFDNKIDFEISVLPYTGDDSWVEATILKLYETLNNNQIPVVSENCDYCSYLQGYSSLKEK